MNPLISIIIVNYNGRRFLQRLLTSIRQQTYKYFETILVDNGSSDDSVTSVQNDFPEVKIIPASNLGYGHGCNLGAKEAKGDFLVFLNEDMYLPDDFLSQMSAYYKTLSSKTTKVGGVGCKMVDFDANPQEVPDRYGGQLDIFGFPVNRYDQNDIFNISGSPFFIQRNTYNKVGGFSDFIFLYGEDTDLSWRLRLMDYKLFMNPFTYIHHYGGGASGGFGSRKIGLILVSPLIAIINCWSTPYLLLLLPLHIMYVLFTAVMLAIYKRDSGVLKQYLLRLSHIWRNKKGIIQKRNLVQSARLVSDRKILKYISLIPAPLYNRTWEKLKDGYVIKN